MASFARSTYLLVLQSYAGSKRMVEIEGSGNSKANNLTENSEEAFADE